MKFRVLLGVTVHGYASIDVETPTKTDLVKRGREILANEATDADFKIEWEGAEDYRVVAVSDELNQDALTDDAIDAINNGE